MKKRILTFIGVIFISANAAAAQKRTVTNEDLEKYRQKRVAAEKDLRENYERLGFPSPEELQKQIERGNAERSALAARLEAENARREQLNLDRQNAENEARNRNFQYQNQNNQNYQGDYFSNFGYSSFGYGGFLSFPNFGGGFNRGGFYGSFGGGRGGNFGNGQRGNYSNQPRIEYRNNLPVIVPPAPPRILAPRQGNGGRRN